MSKRIAAATVAGVVFVFTLLSNVARVFDIARLPEDLREAVVDLSHISSWVEVAIVLIGGIAVLYLMHDVWRQYRPTTPKADCSVESALNHAAHHSVFSPDDPNKWATISRAFRQAAQRGGVNVWGQIKQGGQDVKFSGIEVPIEQTYWELAELNLGTFHIFPNRKDDDRDYERAKPRTTQQTRLIDLKPETPTYGCLRTNRRQILKLWPLKREGGPLNINHAD